MKVELANLAHRATEIDKYRLETCCIVGEYQLHLFERHKYNNITFKENVL